MTVKVLSIRSLICALLFLVKASFGINYSIETFKDSDNTATVKKIINGDFERNFKPIEQDHINYGLIKNNVWGRVTFLKKHNEKLLLEFSSPNLDSIYLYYFDEHGKLKTLYNGVMAKGSSNNLLNRLPTFEIPQNINQAWFKIRSEAMTAASIRVFSVEEKYNKNTYALIFYSILFGLIISIMLYIAFLSFSTFDTDYLTYLFYTMPMLLHYITITGFSALWLPTSLSWLNYYLPCITLPLMFLGFMGFAYNVLLIKNEYYITKVAFKLAITVGIVMIPLAFFTSRSFSIQLGHIVPLIGMVITIIAAVQNIRKKYTPAIYYSLGWIAFMSGASIRIFMDLGWMSYSFFAQNAVFIGSIIEAFFFCISIALKIKFLKGENIRITEQLKKHVQEIESLRELISNEEKDLSVPEISISREELNQYLLNPLSERELDVLYLLSEGKKNKAIAEELFLSVNTVKYHINNIYNKLDVVNRTEAVVKASNMNLLEADVAMS